jgi:hypothetical protein
MVRGKMKWTDTGIQVRKGDTISFAATGRVQWGVNQIVGPEGSNWKLKARFPPAYPVSKIGAGGLIARIGSGSPFAVGKALTAVADETGTLYLGINDNHYENNDGEFSVSVSWVSPQ